MIFRHLHIALLCGSPGEQLVLKWDGPGEDGHIGEVPLDFLLESTYSDNRIQQMVLDKMPTPVKVRWSPSAHQPRLCRNEMFVSARLLHDVHAELVWVKRSFVVLS